MSFFDNFALPSTHVSVENGLREHIRDMFKMNLVEGMVFGQ